MEEYITDYPYLSIELAERLVELEIKALGMDCLSPDSVDRQGTQGNFRRK